MDVEGETLTIQYRIPEDLELIGIGGAGIVFAVDEELVLKAAIVLEPPPQDAPFPDRWLYATSTIFYAENLEKEREILRTLQRQPHQSIVEVVDASQPEGVYLRRYQELPESKCQAERIVWYQDILAALEHLHHLGIAHADLCKQNLLMDSSRRAILCDFSISAMFGTPEYRSADPSFYRSGFSNTLSASTDHFSMACLMFELECGKPPTFGRTTDGGIEFPVISTGNNFLNGIIQHAWKNDFISTPEMLQQVRSLQKEVFRTPLARLGSCAGELQKRIQTWRSDRLQGRGKMTG